MMPEIMSQVTTLTECGQVGLFIVGRIMVEMSCGEYDARKDFTFRNEIRMCYQKKSIPRSQPVVRSSAALTEASSSIEADSLRYLRPLSRVERFQSGIDWHNPPT